MSTRTLREIAEFVDARLIGDDSVVINGVKAIDEAAEGDLTFIANAKYKSKLEETRASAVLVDSEVDNTSTNLLVVKDPYVSWQKF